MTRNARFGRQGPLLHRGRHSVRRLGPGAAPSDLAPQSADADLQFVATFAALAMCHSDQQIHCGLTVVPAGRAPETVAASDDIPVRIDWLQRELTQGPAVSANLGELVVSKDLAADQRWPDFGKLCVAVLDLRSMVSIRIPMAGSDRARLNYYSTEPSALDHLDVDGALSLARSATPALASLLGEFREGLANAVAGDFSRTANALGIVIARYRVDSSLAFNLLLQTARNLDRTLLDIALEVVSCGRLPEGSTQTSRQRRAPEPTSETDRPVVGADRSRHVGGPSMWREPSPLDPGTPVNAEL